jgi:hypothetical protein
MTSARDRLAAEIARLGATGLRYGAIRERIRAESPTVWSEANEENRREVRAILREIGGDVHGEDARRKIGALVEAEQREGVPYDEAFRRVRDRAPGLVAASRGELPPGFESRDGGAIVALDRKARALVAEGKARDYRAALLSLRETEPETYRLAMRERDSRTPVENDE